MREELEIQKITTKIEEQQLRWFGHLVRTSNERSVKQMWEARALQKRNRGKPIVTWDIIVSKILKRKGKIFKFIKGDYKKATLHLYAILSQPVSSNYLHIFLTVHFPFE